MLKIIQSLVFRDDLDEGFYMVLTDKDKNGYYTYYTEFNLNTCYNNNKKFVSHSIIDEEISTKIHNETVKKLKKGVL